MSGPVAAFVVAAGFTVAPLPEVLGCRILFRRSPGCACAVPAPMVMASAAADVAMPARPATLVRCGRPSGRAVCRPTIVSLLDLLYAEGVPSPFCEPPY